MRKRSFRVTQAEPPPFAARGSLFGVFSVDSMADRFSSFLTWESFGLRLILLRRWESEPKASRFLVA